MIFLVPAENVWFRNFPAVFSRSGGVVTGGCITGNDVASTAHFGSFVAVDKGPESQLNRPVSWIKLKVNSSIEENQWWQAKVFSSLV